MPYPSLPVVPPRAQTRPFCSVIIPTFQRPDLLKSCIESVMSHGVGEDHLEILVSDNDPASALADSIAEWSAGRARYTRNTENLGIFRSINATIARSRGEWIHIIADDDWIDPGFYISLEAAIAASPQPCGMAVGNYVVFNEDKKAYFPSQPLAEAPGILGNAFLARLAATNPLRVPAVLIKRETIEKIGLFREDLPYCGDWEFWFRAATKVPWLYVPSAIAYFRVHARSQTRALMRTAQSAEDERRTLDLNEQALPPELVPHIMPRARAHHAGQMLRNAKAALDLKLVPTAERYIREACAIFPEAVRTAEFLACLEHPSMAKLRQQFHHEATRHSAQDRPRSDGAI